MESLLHDMSWVLALRSELLTPIFHGLSWLGYRRFFLIALPVGYWAWDKSKFTRLAILISISALTNAYLKDLWQDPRPDVGIWLEQGAEGSFGLPSGHTQIGIVMWFWLAYEMRQKWAYAAAAIIAGGIAFSRLYLGVHDVEDVMVGALLGVAGLGLYRWFFTVRFDWCRKLHKSVQLGALCAGLAVFFAAWPDGVGRAASIGGFLIAWMAGDTYDETHTHYKRAAEWWKVLLACIVGTAGMIFLFEKLIELQTALAPESEVAIFANGAVLGLYVTVIAPRLFQVVKMARRGTA